VTTGAASAITRIEPRDAAPVDQRASASAAVEDLTLALPPGAGALTLRVASARAQAGGACQAGQAALGGTSQLEGVSVNGVAVPAGALQERLGTLLAPLGLVVELRVDEQLRDTTSLTQRAMRLRVLSALGSAPVLDVVAGEARVGFSEEVCDAGEQSDQGYVDVVTGGGGGGGGTGGGGAGGTTLRPCPSGSELDAARGRCVIRIQSGGTTRTIVVGRPFEGPVGGRVLALTEARKRSKSRCLRGTGPAYAVLGTAKADRITGTNGRDRIVALGGNDRADGGRGADCLDGGAGRDVLSGALGGDRVLGGSGNDNINGGPSTDHLDGGTGNDTLNAAFGRDVVLGGAGRDAINVATAGPPARVSCGSGRDTVRANRNERRRLRGCEVRRVLRD
jgi:hypothetical protein